MDDNDITELAKGMVPFVRNCIAEATAVSPALAEQVANAMQILHDAPPLPTIVVMDKQPRLARIERDGEGNFVPIYNDGSQP